MTACLGTHLVTDTVGRVTNLDDQACPLFDATAREVTGEPAGALLDGDSPSTDSVDQVLDTEAGVQRVEETITTGRGRDVPSEWTTTPPYDAAGESVGVLELGRDVTERRREGGEPTLETYQTPLLADVSDSLRRLADGDLTVDPTVREPPAEFEEMGTVYEGPAETSDDLGSTTEEVSVSVDSTPLSSVSQSDTDSCSATRPSGSSTGSPAHPVSRILCGSGP